MMFNSVPLKIKLFINIVLEDFIMLLINAAMMLIFLQALGMHGV